MRSKCPSTGWSIVALAFLTGATSLPAQTRPGVTAIAAGCLHSLALTSDGSVWQWGARVGEYWMDADGEWGDAAGRAAPTRVSGLGRVVAIASGCDHNLSVREDGTVWAWGSNDGGQLGDGTTTSRRTPVQVNGLTGVVAVSGGSSRSLALKSDGTVWTWGTLSSIYQRQPGDPPTPALTQVSGLTGIMVIASGSGHNLALKGDGTVWAWGTNDGGQLGDGTTVGRSTPLRVSGLSGVVSIAAGGWSSSLALKGDGTVWAWGGNQRTPVQVGGLSEVVSIAGGGVELAVRLDGTVWTLGANGTTGEWVQVSGLSEVTSVASCGGHALALKSDGTVWAWGNNNSHQLGDGTVPQQLTPLPVGGLSGVVAAAAGDAHSMALKGDGTVWAWGGNQAGQLGDGTTTDRWAPAPVGGLSGVVAIAAGERHSLALKEDGTVWAWGLNNLGQLGDGTTTDRSTAVPASGLNGVVAIAASGAQSLALTRDGSVWQWGLNVESPWSNGSGWGQRSTPVPVSGLSGVKAIAAGGWRGLALKGDGTVWYWGVGTDGGWNDQDKPPAQVTGLNGITAIAASSAYSVALKDDGTVWICDPGGWLWGPDWQWLALKPLDQWNGFSGVVAVAVGSIAIPFHFEGYTLALGSDGTVWAAGENWNGELGDGTGIYGGRLTPVQVAGLSGVASVSAGSGHSLAVKRDGTLWAWGRNSSGELGAEPSPYHATPVPVIPPGSPDLAISMTHTGDFTVGDRAVYTLTISNIGLTETAGAVTVKDTLPPGLTYFSASGTDWTCAANDQDLTCTKPGAVDPGASSTIEITVLVGSAAFPGATNLATVTNASDRNFSNNTIGHPTTILPER
ncbi:MAG: DUF11 domain-containing protein [Acidobacteriia bacterium]|nr:DUF11 domain-containing protein [Terriglobia bacterium]